MNIFTYFKEKHKIAQAEKTYQSRLQQTKLRFPYFCKIHGVKPLQHQGALAQSRVGDKLQLVHTPIEGHDFSVCVYSIPLNRVLGYVEEELAEKLIYVFGKGFCRDGEIDRLLGGEPYKYIGCRIRIMDTQEYMEDYEDFSHLYGE